MKKAALTFGLFSLVMVATSFATPEKKVSHSYADNTIEIGIGTDGSGNGGQRTGNGRKTDEYTSSQLKSASNQLNSFASDSQSTRSRVKLD
jgi:hypothetical protein